MFGMILARSIAETGSEERGWDWLRRFEVQTKEYVPTPALMVEKLKRREGLLVTVWELTDMLWSERLDVGTETLIWDRVRHRARRYDRASDPEMRAPSSGLEPAGAPLVARLQATLGWLSGPATVRLPDDAAGLAIPQTSSVVPLAVWNGLERLAPPKSGERRDLTPGRPHALVFARRAGASGSGSGELAVRVYTKGNDRPTWLRLNATQPLPPPFHGSLPRIGDVIRSLLGPGAAGVAKLDQEGVEELRSLGYLR